LIILTLTIALLFAGCTGTPGGSYHYEVNNIEVKRSSFDVCAPDPTLNLDRMTVVKLKGYLPSSVMKSPADVENPNVRATLSIGSHQVTWNIRLERGRSQKIGAMFQSIPEEGTMSVIAQGRDADIFCREKNSWHVSDRKTKQYDVEYLKGSSLSYISLKDERSFVERLFNDYRKLLSEDVSGEVTATRWLDDRLAILERKNNPLSTFLEAYDGAVVAIVVTGSDGVVYRKIYSISGGQLEESSEKPEIIIVLKEQDLEDIRREYSLYEKNSWTPDEVMKLEFLILDRIDFQGGIEPWKM